MTWFPRITINSAYRTLIVAAIFFFLILNLLVLYANYNLMLIIESERNRNQSLNAVLEVLENTASLTNMARLYTVTGDEQYKEYFYHIVAIRNGQEPRPKHYSRFYWDYVLSGNAGHTLSGKKLSLNAKLQQLHFSPYELSLLSKAKDETQDLIVLQEKAFQLMEQAQERQGKYPMGSIKAITEARSLLHSPLYFKMKTKLLEPLEEFQQAVDSRTAENVASLHFRQQVTLFVFQAIILLALLLCIIAYRYTKMQVVKPIKALHKQAEKVAAGDYSVRNQVASHNELETLGTAINKMCGFIEKDIQDREQDEQSMNELNQKMAATLSNLRQKEKENALLNKMNEMLLTAQNADEAYTIIYLTAKDLFSTLSGGLAVYNPTQKKLITVYQWGDGKHLKSEFDESSCWALRNGHLYSVDEPENALLCRHFEQPPLGGYIDLPLVVRGEVIGLINLCAANNYCITGNQRQLSLTFSENIKLALANINLREALRYQALRDGLTGLYNRRYLDETLPREFELMKRSHDPITIALLDIDNFKRINDDYGHDAGDEVLRLIGHHLQQMVRAGDIPCRLGGDEFVVVFVNATFEDARQRLTHIFQRIKMQHPHVQGKRLPGLTLSAGLACAPQHGQSPETVLAAADDALYEAKNSGKNSIKVYRQEQ